MLRLDPKQLAEIQKHAVEAYPHECCGVLLGQRDAEQRVVARAVRCRNAHPNPATRYSIDPAELIAIQRSARESHFQIVGFYHSHPDHPPSVSATDLAEADWTGCSYIIVSVENRQVTAVRSFALTVGEGGRTLIEEALVNAAVPA